MSRSEESLLQRIEHEAAVRRPADPPADDAAGLCAARRAPPYRPQGDEARQRRLWLDPSQTPQGRCPGPHLRPPRQDRHGIDLPPPARLGARLCRPGRKALTRTRQRKADITIANSASARMTEAV